MTLSSGSLKILGAQVSDSGIFQCFASNDAGELSAAAWVQIQSTSVFLIMLHNCKHNVSISMQRMTVNCTGASPIISPSPPARTTAIVDDSVTFACNSTGAPKPRTTWFRGEIYSNNC